MNVIIKSPCKYINGWRYLWFFLINRMINKVVKNIITKTPIIKDDRLVSKETKNNILITEENNPTIVIRILLSK